MNAHLSDGSKIIKFHITGLSDLMLNNPQTVDPLNKYAKELKKLTAKRTKTDADLEKIAQIKFYASLYINADGKYYIPADHFLRSFQSAAKELKLGSKVERSLLTTTDPLLHFKDENKTKEELFKIGSPYVDSRAVGIKNVKIVTTRALIPGWSCDLEMVYDESQLNAKDLDVIAQIAGYRYSVGTYRPRYGKFAAKVIK